MYNNLTTQQQREVQNHILRMHIQYLDVFHEIVDHYASGIEHRMDHEGIPFHDAFFQMKREFSFVEAAKIVGEKEKSLKKYWRSEWMTSFLRWFNPPQVFLLAGLTYLQYLFISQIPYGGEKVTLIFIVLIGCASIFKWKKGRFPSEELKNKYIITKTYFEESHAVFMTLYVPLYILHSRNYENAIIISISAFMLSLFGLYLIFDTFIFPKKLQVEIEKKYWHLDIPFNLN